MTIYSNPHSSADPITDQPGEKPAGPARRGWLSIMGGAALGLGPLLIIGGNLTAPPQASDSSVDYVASLARDPFLTNLSANLYHYGFVALALGMLAAIALVRGRRGAVLTAVGGVGGALGAIQLSGLLVSDWFNGSAARLVGPEQASEILDSVNASASFAFWLLSAKLGIIVIPVLLFVGLARAGVISYWLAPLIVMPMVLAPMVGALVGGGLLGAAAATVIALVGYLPAFLTTARLITRGRLGTA